MPILLEDLASETPSPMQHLGRCWEHIGGSVVSWKGHAAVLSLKHSEPKSASFQNAVTSQQKEGPSGNVSRRNVEEEV